MFSVRPYTTPHISFFSLFAGFSIRSPKCLYLFLPRNSNTATTTDFYLKEKQTCWKPQDSRSKKKIKKITEIVKGKNKQKPLFLCSFSAVNASQQSNQLSVDKTTYLQGWACIFKNIFLKNSTLIACLLAYITLIHLSSYTLIMAFLLNCTKMVRCFLKLLNFRVQSATYCMLTKGTEVIMQVDSNWRTQHHSKHNVQGDKEKARLRQGVLAGRTDEWVC